MQLEPYNVVMLSGFMVAIFLNFKESSMLYLSFSGLLLLGVISPVLDPLDNARAIESAAILELSAAVLFSLIGFLSKGKNALHAGYSMATFSFFNLSAHFSALYLLTKTGSINPLYGMQLRAGECLQLLTVILFSLPVQMLGASLRERHLTLRRGSSSHQGGARGRRNSMVPISG